MAGNDRKSIPSDDIEYLLEIFHDSPWEEMHLVAGDVELFVSTDPQARPPARGGDPAAGAGEARSGSGTPAPPDAAAPPVEPVQQDGGDGLVAVRAPNLGVFYAAPKPGADPYVQVGDAVEEDTPVGLVEVMKLFTTIYAGTRGVIREIKVKDADMVEYDQVLMLVEPAQT